ncbi:hypothetical protein [Quadrisphaera setariae]|uniref:Uncharacterized protein n=1 Tax=Quadrisphaera setariae TaxID=2593304 RepID=A0A5C8ZF91_9ACTN|nr:hypothetical protein [Quadrisphaera setariae]TXR55470.1 hypothetical protein FMM08_14220 [Quadrisphaera setariae]
MAIASIRSLGGASTAGTDVQAEYQAQLALQLRERRREREAEQRRRARRPADSAVGPTGRRVGSADPASPALPAAGPRGRRERVFAAPADEDPRESPGVLC